MSVSSEIAALMLGTLLVVSVAVFSLWPLVMHTRTTAPAFAPAYTTDVVEDSLEREIAAVRRARAMTRPRLVTAGRRTTR
jgi:hypothetical protein